MTAGACHRGIKEKEETIVHQGWPFQAYLSKGRELGDKKEKGGKEERRRKGRERKGRIKKKKKKSLVWCLRLITQS